MRKNQRMNIAVLPEGTEDDVKRLPANSAKRAVRMKVRFCPISVNLVN